MNGQVALMVLVDIQLSKKISGILRLMFARLGLWRTPGLEFYKHMGSGKNGGFSIHPSGTHQALFCVFQDIASLEQFYQSSRLIRWYRAHAQDFFSVKLKAYSIKGQWSGFAPHITAEAPSAGPIVSITRASIKPLYCVPFWRKQPAAEISLEQSSGCIIAAGVGEAPFFRQATFTIWESQAAMDQYARQGAHQNAIRASLSGHYFSESMFSRYIPFDADGSWKGRTLV
ncbi:MULTISPECIES: spheroidene monooxygenase [unclassified Polynucleobacter]|uniref:spheroidene monooxygenase n=1 Tax=unclassified Polynucleobacter TaxID=2640945 RepID=UPI001C0B2AD2|nr:MULTISPECIES: spheroidene monooxygenase [unclassified Polynucleobacter]MBU3603801.1 spheroidene monooxygenase [Polynucleobacter sp. AP-Kaivos-20-H2]MBU3619353.1 spheroidene monooxygenase [Polynucleobacter sp. JS-Fieb-80-E5]